MPRVAVAPSPAVAQLLHKRRQELGLSLRQVQERAESLGTAIPFTTLAKIERGVVDPGIRRLYLLLKLYEIPPEVVAEVVDLEEFSNAAPAGELPLESFHEAGIDHWKDGDLRKGLAYLVTLRALTPSDPDSRRDRQRGILNLSIQLGSLGKFRLSQQLVNDLLVEPPEANLVIPVLIQSARCWHWLGSAEAALGFLDRAESHVDAEDHQRRAWIHHERASALVTLEQFDPAETALRKAIAEYRAAEDPYGECRAMESRVRSKLERRDPKAAVRLARATREHALKHGFKRIHTTMLLAAGQGWYGMGDASRATSYFRRALAEAVAADDRMNRFFAHHGLWKAYEATGDREQARVELTSARYYSRFVEARTPETAEVRAIG